MGECTLCYVVSENIFESSGIPFADEISCVTPRYYRQKQTALLGGAGPPSIPRSPAIRELRGNVPEVPGSGAWSLQGPLADL